MKRQLIVNYAIGFIVAACITGIALFFLWLAGLLPIN